MPVHTARARPLRVLVAVTSSVGTPFLFFGSGALRWFGAMLLVLACLVAFADGYKGWSRP